MMRILWIVLTAWLAVSIGLGAEKKKASKPKLETMVGCVDEKTEGYVLRDDRMLRTLASLEPVGFEKEGFAKFVGHKVSVSGKVEGTQDAPVMKVQSIKVVNDLCAASDEGPPK